MKALVLGGSGFIGSHLVDRLLTEQHQVAVLDVKPAALPVECFVGQLEDSDLLKKALQGRDLVFHTVSTTVPATSNKNMEFDIASNLISFVRLLELMRENQVERVVYLSSGGAVYGNPIDYPIREEHPLNPISSYGIVKVAAEKYLFLFQELYGLKPIIIRPSNAYGPRQSIVKPQGIIGHFLSRALQGQPLEIWG
ncbi:MAG: NAD-dependent epimerase/dehydratase family protein, partial [bacterium]|nr:NAD-dependent epimerase/dehydratase family protein [bacterium]